MSTYLQIVNRVLVKMREDEVTSVADNAYSRLIGTFVNETRREVEDSYQWLELRETISITTVPGVFNYRLPGTNERSMIRSAMNDTQNHTMHPENSEWLTRAFLLAQPQQGNAYKYGLNGFDQATRERFVDVYPIPSSPQVLRFNMQMPQNDLTQDSQVCLVPPHLVVLGAFRLAVAERGDDDRVVQRADLAFQGALATAISQNVENFPGETDWQPV